MDIFNTGDNKYRYVVKERQKEIIEEKRRQLDKAINEEEAKKQELEVKKTKEEIKKEREERRKETVLQYFKYETGRDMSEEEYLEYITIFNNDKTRPGYSIFSYIMGDKEGKEKEVKK